MAEASSQVVRPGIQTFYVDLTIPEARPNLTESCQLKPV